MEITTSRYSCEGGVYASVLPDKASSEWLNEICSRAAWYGFETNNLLDRHCTVVHSTTPLPRGSLNSLLNIPTTHARWCDSVFKAQAARLHHWTGHNDEGYIVLLLEDCPELVEYNRILVERYSLAVTFDYQPHITIARDAYAVSSTRAALLCDQLNLEFLSTPVDMCLTGLRFENLS